jgi:hypothetical protein
MGWGRLDGKFSGHRKRRLATLAADGLLARAISHTAEHEQDGFVDEAWVMQQGSPSERRRALETALRVGLVEPLPPNTTRELVGHAKPGLRPRDVHVTVGPYDEAGFLVHDYLDFNPSAVEQEERRGRGRAKKREQRAKPRLWNGAQATMSPNPSPVSNDAGSGGGTTATKNGEHRDLSRGPVDQVIAILAAAPRFQLTAEMADSGLQSAINANPGKDPVVAAHAAVAMVSDPAFRMTSPVRTFMLALEKQQPGERPAGTTGQNVADTRERTCSVCKVARVPVGMGAQCERCAEAIAS